MKTSRRVSLFSIIAIAILSSVAISANAATIMQTKNYGAGTPNFTETLTFNKFDPSLGTLNSVKIKMLVNVSGGSLTVDNDGVDPASVTVELGADGAVTSTDVTIAPTVGASASTGAVFNLAAENGDGPSNIDPSGPDGAVHNGGSDSGMDMQFINAAFFSDYTGLGTFDVDAEIDQILDFGSIGGVEGSFTPVTADGNVMITYDYTAVPEPSSIAMIILGLVGFFFARKRK